MLPNLLLTALLVVIQRGDEDGGDLMQQCIASRARIVSGEVRLAQEVLGPEERVGQSEYRIVFDMDHLRVDRSGPSGIRKRILTPDSVMRWDGNVEHGVQISHRGTEEGEPGPLLQVFDPRVIGMTPALPSHWYSCRWSDLLSVATTEFSVTDENIGGTSVKHVQFRRLGNPVSVWIAPDKGPSIVRAEVSQSEGALTDTMSCSPTFHEDCNVWFPSELTHRRTRDGELVTEYRIRVMEARFNHNIDHTEFTLRSLDPAKGAYIRQPQKSISVWDGEKAVPIAQTTIEAQPGERKWLIRVGLALFGLGVAFGIARMLRAHR